MSLQPILPLASMNIPALLAAHNELAVPRAAPLLKSWKDSRCKLAERVAILRTQKIVVIAEPKSKATPKRRRIRRPAKKRGTPIRSAILRALAIVSHYENTITGRQISKYAAWRFNRSVLLSVGLPYPEVLAIVRKEFPQSKVSGADLRWTATAVRERKAGFEKCNLPQKRPHGATKGRR